jgi:hypothetical protein
VTAAARSSASRNLEGLCIVEINDTIQTLAKIRQSVDTWIPHRTTRPDALIADLNDSYVAAIKNRSMDELFVYDDVGSPSLTLIVGLEAAFDLQKVMKNLRTRLRIPRPGRADEIGAAGIVWSHGRYDFVYDRDSGCLRISHKYSHEHVDAKSVASIVRQMIDHAIDYLEEVKASAKESAGAPKPEEIRLPRESEA